MFANDKCLLTSETAGSYMSFISKDLEFKCCGDEKRCPDSVSRAQELLYKV